MAIPVPSAFRSPSTHRVSSDPPRSSGVPRPDSGQRPKSGPRTLDPSSPTMLADAPTAIAPPSRVTTTRSMWWIAGGAAAVLIGAALTSPLWRDRQAQPSAAEAVNQTPAPAPEPQPASQPPSTTPQAAVPLPPPPAASAEDDARLLRDARARMSAAKAAARQQGAAVQRSAAFTDALAAEREAPRPARRVGGPQREDRCLAGRSVAAGPVGLPAHVPAVAGPLEGPQLGPVGGRGLALDSISASYTDGVLSLTIPVSEEAKPRKVEVSHTGGSTAIGQGSSEGRQTIES